MSRVLELTRRIPAMSRVRKDAMYLQWRSFPFRCPPSSYDMRCQETDVQTCSNKLLLFGDGPRFASYNMPRGLLSIRKCHSGR